MPQYVLDTHALVFALTTQKKLGARAQRALRSVEAGQAVAWIPTAVVAEFILLRELGRIEIGMAHLKTALEEAPGLRFLPQDLRQLDQFAALGAIRDVFDRQIISAARSLEAKLLTKDQMIEESGLIQTVWS